MKKIISGILITLIVIAIIFGVHNLLNPKSTNTSELTTIQLNEVTRSVFYAPQYVFLSA